MKRSHQTMFYFLSLASIAILSGCTKAKSTDDSNLSSGLIPETTSIAFFSQASNLIEGVNPTGQFNQVYLKNFKTGEIKLASSTETGEEANNGAFFSSQSADASKVVFFSGSNNLYPNIINSQAFMKDMNTGKLQLVSTNENGEQSNGQYVDFFLKVSLDGNRVAFMTNATNLTDTNPTGDFVVFVKDMTSGKIIRLDTNNNGANGNGGFQSSSSPSMNFDGSKIAFQSNASNLLDNDVNGSNWDIYLKDFETGELTLISSAADGTQANGGSWDAQISGDGNWVTFISEADNLVPDDTNSKTDLFIKNIASGEIIKIDLGNGNVFAPALNYDGSKLTFSSTFSYLAENDTNDTYDLFLLDLNSGEISLLSRSNDGNQGQSSYMPFLSLFTPDGNKVYFQTQNSFVDDDQITHPGDEWLDTDIYLKDLTTGDLSLINRNAEGGIGNSRARFDGNW
jgi:hypothetical protein